MSGTSDSEASPSPSSSSSPSSPSSSTTGTGRPPPSLSSTSSALPSPATPPPTLSADDVIIGKVRFQRKDVIGTGSNGTLVFKGMWRDRVPVAVKQIHKQVMEVFHTTFREGSVLLHLAAEADTHPSLVRYIDQEEDDIFLYLVTELCDMSLADHIASNPAPEPTHDSSQLMTILLDVAQGVSCLHQHGIVHNDITPRNVLVKGGRGKISDMGLSKILDGDRRDGSFLFTSVQPSGVGGWYAPEVLTRGRLTNKVDIFSMGCLFYYILTGAHPFGEGHYRTVNILEGRPSIERLTGRPEAHSLVGRMLSHDPEGRPTADQVVRHPMFWSDEFKLRFLEDANQAIHQLKAVSPDAKALSLKKFLNYTTPTTTSSSSSLSSPSGGNLFLSTTQHGGAHHHHGGGGGWDRLVHKELLETQAAAHYNPQSVLHLLRFIRNIRNHYTEYPPHVQHKILHAPHGIFAYFAQRVPCLVLHVFDRVATRHDLLTSPSLAKYY
eukprot:TRINITY_DN2736_c1_g1_i1.p1 TRINITY_DN2736_c1_g1~~TRINITY_DN2736_c1_g1_i1.p1  ORF type:complete len:575 (+),score=114.91 TRINITY_DN2736_c1_g1_i1:244-1725(+)